MVFTFYTKLFILDAQTRSEMFYIFGCKYFSIHNAIVIEWKLSEIRQAAQVTPVNRLFGKLCKKLTRSYFLDGM